MRKTKTALDFAAGAGAFYSRVRLTPGRIVIENSARGAEAPIETEAEARIRVETAELRRALRTLGQLESAEITGSELVLTGAGRTARLSGTSDWVPDFWSRRAEAEGEDLFAFGPEFGKIMEHLYRFAAHSGRPRPYDSALGCLHLRGRAGERTLTAEAADGYVACRYIIPAEVHKTFDVCLDIFPATASAGLARLMGDLVIFDYGDFGEFAAIQLYTYPDMDNIIARETSRNPAAVVYLRPADIAALIRSAKPDDWVIIRPKCGKVEIEVCGDFGLTGEVAASTSGDSAEFCTRARSLRVLPFGRATLWVNGETVPLVVTGMDGISAIALVMPVIRRGG